MSRSLDTIIPPGDLFEVACDAQDGDVEAFARVMRYAAECVRLGVPIHDRFAPLVIKVLLDTKPKRKRGRPSAATAQSSLGEMGDWVTVHCAMNEIAKHRADIARAAGKSEEEIADARKERPGDAKHALHKLVEEQGFTNDAAEHQRQFEAVSRKLRRRRGKK